MTDESREKWKVVSEYRLEEYPCGVRAGDRVVLQTALEMTDEDDVPTGASYKAGDVWKVLMGNASEPSVVWLRNPAGREHTWDDHIFWRFFKRA